MAKQDDYCSKCGRKLNFLTRYGGSNICTNCYDEAPLCQPGQVDVIHLSPSEYESWVRVHGSEVEIINVERETGGIYSGGTGGKFPISYRRRGGFLVTYRRK